MNNLVNSSAQEVDIASMYQVYTLNLFKDYINELISCSVDKRSIALSDLAQDVTYDIK